MLTFTEFAIGVFGSGSDGAWQKSLIIYLQIGMEQHRLREKGEMNFGHQAHEVSVHLDSARNVQLYHIILPS
jgi:hypothetical protein